MNNEHIIIIIRKKRGSKPNTKEFILHETILIFLHAKMFIKVKLFIKMCAKKIISYKYLQQASKQQAIIKPKHNSRES